MDGLIDDLEFEDFSFEEVDNLSVEEDEDDNTVLDAEDGEQELQEEDEAEGDEDTEGSEEQDGESTEEEESEDQVSYTAVVEALIEDGVLKWDGETEYDDSPEGFKQIIEDNAKQLYQETLDSLPEKVRRLVEIGLNGGDVQEAFQRFEEINYEDVDITDESVAKSIVKDFYKSTNPKWNDARIARQLEMLEDAGDLEEEAGLAKEYFVEKTATDRRAYAESVRLEREAQEKAYYDELNAYTKIIDDSEQLAGIKFANKAQKEEFKKYVFERGEDGMTQAERDDQDRTTRLTKEWYKFNKFNYEHIEKKATTKNAIKLKTALSRFADKNASSNRQGVNRQSSDKNKFTLGSLPDDF